MPLSIFVSAIQNKKAGKKLPINPEKTTKKSLFFGIFLKESTANGVNTIPALNIRNAATW